MEFKQTPFGTEIVGLKEALNQIGEEGLRSMGAIRERPILFSSPMIRAIIAGHKSMTRRVVKPQPIWVGDPSVPFKTPDADPKGIIRCPYGQPGDRLWVREAHRFDMTEGGLTITYRADGAVLRVQDNAEQIAERSLGKWRPPMFMPRWASRITLEVTGVRVERLQDINASDAKKEGVSVSIYDETERERIGSWTELHIFAFYEIWESINGKKYPWDSNPWVWVIEFTKN